MPEQIKIRLGGSQLSDLSILRDIGSKQLKTFIKKVKSLSPVPLEIKELSRILDNLFPDAKTDSEAVIRQLMSLYAFRRKRNLSGKEISDAITHGIKSAPKNIRWDIKGINKWKQAITTRYGTGATRPVRSLAAGCILPFSRQTVSGRRGK